MHGTRPTETLIGRLNNHCAVIGHVNPVSLDKKKKKRETEKREEEKSSIELRPRATLMFESDRSLMDLFTSLDVIVG